MSQLDILAHLSQGDTSWLDEANCEGLDPKDFDDPEQVTAAKAVCLGCDVVQRCLGYALDNEIATNVIGGLDKTERGVLVARIEQYTYELEELGLIDRPQWEALPVSERLAYVWSLVDDYEERIANYLSGPGHKTERPKHIKWVGFLDLMFSGSSNDDLEKYVLDNSPKFRKSSEEYGRKALAMYKNLFQRTKDIVEAKPLEDRRLDDLVYTFLEDGRINSATAGQFLLLFGFKQAPAGVSPAIVETAMQQAAAKIRDRLNGVSKAELTKDMNLAEGHDYMFSVVGERQKYIRPVSDIAENLILEGYTNEGKGRYIETYLAYMLERLYPARVE